MDIDLIDFSYTKSMKIEDFFGRYGDVLKYMAMISNPNLVICIVKQEIDYVH